MTAATAGSATAHKVDTDFTGENVRSYPATVWVRGRVFRDLPGQFPRIDRLPAMLGVKNSPCHLSPHPGPVSRRDRGIGRPSDCR